MAPRTRLAVIDLGSNSFRLVVFEAGEGWWRRTDEIYEPVRIGEGLMATGRLGEEPMRTRAGDARRVRALLPGERPRTASEVDAVATSAIRDADNAPGVPRAGARALPPADPRAQPRAGGALRLPGGGQLDDARRRLRARPRRRLDAARRRGRTAGAQLGIVAARHRAHERALPAAERPCQAPPAERAARAHRAPSSAERRVAGRRSASTRRVRLVGIGGTRAQPRRRRAASGGAADQRRAGNGDRASRRSRIWSSAWRRCRRPSAPTCRGSSPRART